MTCLTPGTLIATPQGESPVEDLVAGMRVVTRDNGLRPLDHVGLVKLDYGLLSARPHLRPVLMRQGCLDHGMPERDMLVSPNQRVLVDSRRSALPFEDHEALIAAKHLVNSRDIRPVSALGVSYIHLHCRGHQVVLANGIWLEAFDPADRGLGGLGNAQRSELDEIFGIPRSPDRSRRQGPGGNGAVAPIRR